MYRHRELLMSMLTSAMLTATVLPSVGAFNQASVVNPAGVRQALESAISNIPTGGWTLPAVEILAAADATPVVISVNAGPAAAKAPVITPARMKQLADRAMLNEATSRIGAYIAVPLGLSAAEPLMTKQIGEVSDEETRVFAAPATPNGKYLVFTIKAGTIRTYACDANGKLLAAGTVVNKVFTPMTVQAAAAGFETEMRFWAAAELSPGNA